MVFQTFDDDLPPQGPRDFDDENITDTTHYEDAEMGEAGFGTAAYGEDTETFEVEQGDITARDEDEDSFGFDEDADDSAAYEETGDGFSDEDL